MKNRLFFLLMLIMMGSTIVGCQFFQSPPSPPPRPTSLPPITQNGANTFGCLIDGDLMVAIDGCTQVSCIPNPYFDSSIGFGIAGTMDTARYKVRYFLDMQFDNIKVAGVYSMDTIAKKRTNGVRINGTRVQKEFGAKFSTSSYDSTSYCRGVLHITKWVRGVNGFCSGTFWYDLYDPANHPDTVHVREGRFDIKLSIWCLM